MNKCESPPKTQADACTGQIYDRDKYFYNTYNEYQYCLACIEEFLIDRKETFDGLIELQEVAIQYNYKLIIYDEKGTE